MTTESTRLEKNNTPLRYTFASLYCLAFREVVKLYFLLYFSTLPERSDTAALIWLALQVVFSIVVGHLSDKHCRKKSLVITSLLSFFSVFLLFNGYLYIAIFFDGIFCNATPVCRAAYCDVNYGASKLRLIATSYFFQALPWIVLCSTTKIYNIDVITLLYPVLFFICFVFSVFLFKDIRDRSHDGDIDIYKTIQRHLKPNTVRVLISYFLLGLGYHIMDYYIDTHFTGVSLQESFFLLGLGIAGGNILHRFIKFHASTDTLSIVYLICCSLFIFGLVSSLVFENDLSIKFIYFLPFSFIGSFALPLIYSIFTSNAKIHEEGFLFGILESTLTFAEFLGPLLASIISLTFHPFIIIIGLAFLVTFKFRMIPQESQEFLKKLKRLCLK